MLAYPSLICLAQLMDCLDHDDASAQHDILAVFLATMPSPLTPVGCCRSLKAGVECYRLCETFASFGGGKLASPTFAHALDPQWPLCAFEHAPRGACHDAACAAQMTVDYWLPPKLALDNVAKLAARSEPHPSEMLC